MAPTSSSEPEAGAVAAAPDPLVHVAFNQHGTHFVAATATGFHVFSCHPLVRVMHKCGPAVASPGRTVSSAELLTRSQLAVVTRGTDDGDTDAIDFWNGLCKEGKVASVTSPHGAVGGIRLQGEYMLVAGEEKAKLCFGSNRDKDVMTGPNPLGLCAMAAGTEGQGTGSSLVSYALPRKLVGEVQVRRRLTPGSVDVRAHDSAVACIALSHDGRLLATAGSRGTLVRVFSTADGSKLQELRRGTDGATIHCIAFSPDSKWLAVTSDKTTVHVFRLADFNLTSSSPEDGYDGYVIPAASEIPSPPAQEKAKQGSSMSFLKGYLPTYFSSEWPFAMNRSPAGYLPTYFSSEWSFAQFRLRKATKCSVAFDQQHPNTITIVGIDRSFYRCEFDPVKRGAMREVKYIKNFMHSMM